MINHLFILFRDEMISAFKHRIYQVCIKERIKEKDKGFYSQCYNANF